MHRCQNDAKTRNTREITRQKRSLHPTCLFRSISLGANSLFLFAFYSENIHAILGCHFFNQAPGSRASEPRTDVAIIDRGRFHCDDPLSARGRSVQSGFIATVTTARCHATHRRRESPDLERETAAATARFSRHILSARLFASRREKNVESCGFHREPLSLPEKVD